MIGWTLFTTINGTIGPSGLSHVELFDTNNDGIDTNSARFRVGQVIFGLGPAGGVLFQEVKLLSGDLIIEANIAALARDPVANLSAGRFDLLLDGVSVDHHSFGEIASNTSEHSMLASVSAITVICPH